MAAGFMTWKCMGCGADGLGPFQAEHMKSWSHRKIVLQRASLEFVRALWRVLPWP